MSSRLELRHSEIGHHVVCYVPVSVRGGLGSLVIGNNSKFGYPLAPMLGNGSILLQPRTPTSTIRIGAQVSFSNNVSIVSVQEVVVGDRCLIGDLVTIADCDGHEIAPETRRRSVGKSGSVVIESDVWLGSRVIVTKGVTIGCNTVVGAMSVVTSSLPPNCVAAGVPATVIRFIDSTEGAGGSTQSELPRYGD